MVGSIGCASCDIEKGIDWLGVVSEGWDEWLLWLNVDAVVLGYLVGVSLPGRFDGVVSCTVVIYLGVWL